MKRNRRSWNSCLHPSRHSWTNFTRIRDRASHFLALAQKYTDFTELTAPMIHDICGENSGSAPDRSTGERVQEIEIYLNFIGKFEVPMPEPTEEELAAEEKRRQKRIRDHEKISAPEGAQTEDCRGADRSG